MEESTDLTVIESHALESWDGAAIRGLQARQEREQIIAKVLKKGADFGIIPGTDKPTLLKPGAEKISDSLNLWPDYVCEAKVEDWDKPLFFYRYRAVLRSRGSNLPVASGLGSCNSMEDRYRWRKSSRVCPSCAKDAIITGKAEYGGGFVCFKKKGGCGAKFKDTDERITSQPLGKVPNEDVFSQVNTIDKMAQKRALVAAALNLGFSEHFTQDMEDLAAHREEPEVDPAWFDPKAPMPEPEMSTGDPRGIGEASELPLKNVAISKTKRDLHEELLAWPEDKRDAVVRKYSAIIGDDGKPTIGKGGKPLCVESLERMMSEKISEKWAAATLGKVRDAKQRIEAEKGTGA